MATLVNDGMSPALFAAIKRTREAYSRTGYLSTTSCIDSPRVRVLAERHDHEMVIRASTFMSSFVGTCVHTEIEKYDKIWEIDGIAQEKECVIDIAGIKFSGRPDWYSLHEQEVGDYKNTSVWTYQYNPNGKSEHIKQININGYLIRRWGYPCTKGWIELIFSDWKLANAKRDPRYPRRSELIRVDNLWPDAEVEAFLTERIKLHLAADKETDQNLPFCTEQEQWRKPHEFAVIKKGNARATKVCTKREEAEELQDSLGGRRYASIEERPGERTRCEDYCEVKEFCNQYVQERANV